MKGRKKDNKLAHHQYILRFQLGMNSQTGRCWELRKSSTRKWYRVEEWEKVCGNLCRKKSRTNVMYKNKQFEILN